MILDNDSSCDDGNANSENLSSNSSSQNEKRKTVKERPHERSDVEIISASYFIHQSEETNGNDSKSVNKNYSFILNIIVFFALCIKRINIKWSYDKTI